MGKFLMYGYMPYKFTFTVKPYVYTPYKPKLDLEMHKINGVYIAIELEAKYASAGTEIKPIEKRTDHLLKCSKEY